MLVAQGDFSWLKVVVAAAASALTQCWQLAGLPLKYQRTLLTQGYLYLRTGTAAIFTQHKSRTQ